LGIHHPQAPSQGNDGGSGQNYSLSVLFGGGGGGASCYWCKPHQLVVRLEVLEVLEVQNCNHGHKPASLLMLAVVAAVDTAVGLAQAVLAVRRLRSRSPACTQYCCGGILRWCRYSFL
jgi:hypothetical protein